MPNVIFLSLLQKFMVDVVGVGAGSRLRLSRAFYWYVYISTGVI